MHQELSEIKDLLKTMVHHFIQTQKETEMESVNKKLKMDSHPSQLNRVPSSENPKEEEETEKDILPTTDSEIQSGSRDTKMELEDFHDEKDSTDEFLTKREALGTSVEADLNEDSRPEDDSKPEPMDIGMTNESLKLKQDPIRFSKIKRSDGSTNQIVSQKDPISGKTTVLHSELVLEPKKKKKSSTLKKTKIVHDPQFDQWIHSTITNNLNGFHQFCNEVKDVKWNKYDYDHLSHHLLQICEFSQKYKLKYGKMLRYPRIFTECLNSLLKSGRQSSHYRTLLRCLRYIKYDLDYLYYQEKQRKSILDLLWDSYIAMEETHNDYYTAQSRLEDLFSPLRIMDGIPFVFRFHGIISESKNLEKILLPLLNYMQRCHFIYTETTQIVEKYDHPFIPDIWNVCLEYLGWSRIPPPTEIRYIKGPIFSQSLYRCHLDVNGLLVTDHTIYKTIKPTKNKQNSKQNPEKDSEKNPEKDLEKNEVNIEMDPEGETEKESEWVQISSIELSKFKDSGMEHDEQSYPLHDGSVNS